MEVFIKLLETIEKGSIDNQITITNVDLFIKAWKREAESLQLRKADVSGSLNNKLKIEFKSWDYQCADGCCTLFGCDVFLNDEKLDEQHADDHVNALNAILPKLGYEVEILNN